MQQNFHQSPEREQIDALLKKMSKNINGEVGLTLEQGVITNISSPDADKFMEGKIASATMDSLFESFASINSKKKSNSISIGGNIIIFHILPKCIKQFETLYPQIEFKIKNLNRPDAIKRVIDDELDIAIYSMVADQIPHELNFIPIAKYSPILLTHKDHPLATKKDLILSDIKEYKLLRLDPQFVTVPNFDSVVQEHGLKTSIEFEMANYEILKKFVKAEVGIAIVSGICLENEADKDLVSRDLSRYFPSLTYGMMVKKEKIHHPLLREFVGMLQNNYKNTSALY